MITTTKLTSSLGDVITVKYPTGMIFIRERNYLTVSSDADDYYLKKITLAGKTINFGRYYLMDSPMTLDVTPYYAKLYGNSTISLVVETSTGEDETFTVSFTISKIDGYSPYKEITASVCNETSLAVITPPNRMIWDGKKQIKSLFAAKRNAGTSGESYRWRINGTDDGSILILKNINIGTSNFFAEYIRKMTASNTDIVLSTITRSAEVRDSNRDVVYVTWRTRWGLDVSHVFYLDKYATDKEDAKEVESLYLYEENSKHVLKGSFYLDNIRDPYDLWYYQTLANSELVILTFDRWDTMPDTYMPNGTNAFNGVKITGSNIKDAVVDGITQQTITFDFELR